MVSVPGCLIRKFGFWLSEIKAQWPRFIVQGLWASHVFYAARQGGRNYRFIFLGNFIVIAVRFISTVGALLSYLRVREPYFSVLSFYAFYSFPYSQESITLSELLNGGAVFFFFSFVLYWYCILDTFLISHDRGGGWFCYPNSRKCHQIKIHQTRARLPVVLNCEIFCE